MSLETATGRARPLVAVAVADLMLEAAAGAEFAPVTASRPIGDGPLLLQRQTEVVEKQVDAAQSHPPSQLRTRISGELAHDGEYRVAIGMKHAFGEKDPGDTRYAADRVPCGPGIQGSDGEGGG